MDPTNQGRGRFEKNAMLAQRREKPFSLKQTQLLSTLTMERGGHPKLRPKNQAPFFKRCSCMRGRRLGFVAAVAHLYAAEEEREHPMLRNKGCRLT